MICLTTETAEIVFALGAGDRVAGVSGYCVRPPEARLKEKIGAFTSIRIEKIRRLNPDLILGFSDLQKDIARELIAEGFNVFITNQRTLEETGDAILAIGRLIGEEEKAATLCTEFFDQLNQLNVGAGLVPARAGRPQGAPLQEIPRPRIYFEEWDQPMISGISWVSELIERLGGRDIFQSKSAGKNAKDRFVTSEEVIAANPDIIIASWCGKKARLDQIRLRPGWENIEAVKRNQLFEIKSADILSPGLSLLYGARKMAEIITNWREGQGASSKGQG